MNDETFITVELTEHEARALTRTGEFIASTLGPDRLDDQPPALVTACDKLHYGLLGIGAAEL